MPLIQDIANIETAFILQSTAVVAVKKFVPGPKHNQINVGLRIICYLVQCCVWILRGTYRNGSRQQENGRFERGFLFTCCENLQQCRKGACPIPVEGPKDLWNGLDQ